MTGGKWGLGGVVGTLAVCGAYFALGDVASALLYQAVSLFAVVAIVVGTARHRPARRGAWLALAAGMGCWTVGDALWNVDMYVRHVESPFPGVADIAYLAGYPLLAGGLAGLARGQRREDRIESTLDAWTMTIGLAVAVWFPVLSPIVRGDGGSLAQSIAIAYPIGTLICAAMTIRLAFDGSRSWPARLLLLGMVSSLAADLAYAYLVNAGSYVDAIDAGWLVGYIAIGVAALRPDMARLAPAERPSSPARWRLTMLWFVALEAPVLLVVEELRGEGFELVLIALTAVLTALVVARMTRLASLAARRAHLDPLTGLPNRAGVLARLQAHLDTDRGPVTVLFCDLDRFKGVNDTSGHAAGDSLLVAIAERLRRVVPHGACVGRLGGDEFVVFGSAVTVEPDELADRVHRSFDRPFALDGRSFRISTSTGVAVSGDAETADALLAAADAALYMAKANGKDRWVMHDAAIRARVTDRQELERELDDALAAQGLTVHYQPIVDTGTGTPVGVEALVRWHHPTMGSITPDRFVPLAEETGRINDLGRHVLATAVGDVAALGSDIELAVNVSARQFDDDRLVADVEHVLTRFDFRAHRLVLEITESVLLDPNPSVLDQMRALQGRGVRFAVDDFGTGYSSLLRLSALPVDVLKIDRAFVRELDTDERNATIVAALVRLADGLDLELVAEGVEREAERDLLQELGCAHAQGFLWSRPVPLDELRNLLAQRRIDIAVTATNGLITVPPASSTS